MNLGVKELKKVYFWRDVFSEFLGTVFFLYMIVTVLTKLQTVDVVQISLCIGISLAVVIHIFGPVSGGHINPAVTCAAFLTGHVTLVRAIFYTVAQLLGSVAGSAIAYGATPNSAGEMYGVVAKNKIISAGQGLISEIVLTMLLLLAVFSSVCNDHGRKNFGFGNAFAIGEAVVVAHLAGCNYSGSSINPARAFGPSIVTGVFPDHHWIYWVGPYLAAVLSAFIYKYVIAKEEPEAPNLEGEERIPLNNCSKE